MAGGVTIGTQAAQAQAPLPLTPVLDCVANAGGGIYIAYFGYDNTGPVIDFPVGDFNEVIPGDPFQGQPTTFNVGAYPNVFRVEFDPVISPSVSWLLNGL